MKQTIGEFLSALRKAHGLTQREVADRLDVSNRTISAWERGTVMPDILLLPALAELYGVTTDEILTGARRPEPGSEEQDPSELSDPKRAIAPFSMWAAILTAVFAVGASLLFAGWYSYIRYLGTLHRELCLSLLCVGLILSFLCATVLVVLWHRWETDADPALTVALRKRMTICLGAAAALFLLFAVIASVPPIKLVVEASPPPSDALAGWLWETIQTPVIGYSVLSAVCLLLSVGLFLTGMILLKRSQKKLTRDRA